MADRNIIAVHLAKLQSALLDGRISQEQYDRLKSDLLAAGSPPDLDPQMENNDWPTEPNGKPWPMGYDGQPVDPKVYSPQWQYIKRWLVDNDLGYMIDTQEKRNKLAKDVGFLVGFGEGFCGYEILRRLGIMP
jgi:hypothetical protein